MTPEKIAAIVAGSVVLLTVLITLRRALPKRLKKDKFTEKWRLVQSFCRDKTTWSQAIISADNLLDEALKRRKFKGKSMGERLVSARVAFTNNDVVWFAHNIVKKALINPDKHLKEDDVKRALMGFRQALRDLGALPSPPEEKDKEETA